MKIRAFFTFKPLGKVFTKTNIFDAFCSTNIYSTKTILKIKPIHRTASLYELVMCNLFIWVSVSTYIDNGTAKVPILA